MSSIDQYQHKFLGFINCPSDFDVVPGNTTRKVAIYELLEDIPADEIYFDGRVGDVLVGGGSGEARAMRISFPECLEYFLSEEKEFIENVRLFKTFWSPTTAFKFCDGYLKAGWDPGEEIEFWLARNVCGYLVSRGLKVVSGDGKIEFDSKLFSEE